MYKAKHLLWIVGGAGVGFLASFIFGDLLSLPLDLYYLIYFTIITLFFVIYIRYTNCDIQRWFSKRIIWGLILGLIFSILMMQNVLSRPETAKLEGPYLLWSIFWRGIVYGLIDGLLLSAFPWLVTWRTFNAEEGSWGKKVAVGFLSLVFVLIMTTFYHLGYSDFRSPKLVQANIGNTIMSVPTLLTANPIASPITHATMHVTAVIHSPETELFLPPHRE